MSYDIRFGVKVEGAKDVYVNIGRPEYDSPTYNNRDIFDGITKIRKGQS